ncbi:MAG TPA: RNA-binding protein [Candidatus Magasanikbacteria bacterium]|nr:RNA-binding protein [Candidatus Magasanikbacteria bacterium]
MGKKLYVGGISYSSTDDSLRNYFAQAGTVESATILMDNMTGRSRGFGFVEMATDEEAQAAIDMFNGKEFEGRTLTVNEARPKEDRPARSGGFNRGGNGGGRGGFRRNDD